MTPARATGRIVVEGLSVGTLVRGLDFTAEPGMVTGLVGPPGSGKTLVLRTVVGLVRPRAGRVSIDGAVGVMLNDPGFHPVRTARDHLRVYAAGLGVDIDRVQALLELVGLDQQADQRVGRYSYEMRQRLALATAMLDDPPALVLDQPGLGLNGTGIAWLHQLIREYAALNRTVLIAGRDLDGVADHRVAPHGGGGVREVREPIGGPRGLVVITTTDPVRLVEVLRASGVSGVALAQDGTVLVDDGQSLRIAEIADAARTPILAMHTRRVDG